MTPEQHHARRQQVGASEVAALFGIHPYLSAWEMQQTKLGNLEQWGGAKWTDAGQRFEGALLDIAEEELGSLSRQVRLIHPDLPLAATCDALAIDSRNEPVEAKTTGLVGPVQGRWGDAGTDEIPDYYLLQVHAQLMCSAADLAYLYALIGGRGVVRYEVEPNATIHEMIGNTVDNWWERYIVQGQVLPRTELPKLEVVKRLRREPNKTIALPAELSIDVDDWLRCKEVLKAHEQAKQSKEAAILMALGDAECGILPDGRRVENFIQTRNMPAKAAYQQRFPQLKIRSEH